MKRQTWLTPTSLLSAFFALVLVSTFLYLGEIISFGPAKPPRHEPQWESASADQQKIIEDEKQVLSVIGTLITNKAFEVMKADDIFSGMGHIGQAMPEFHFFYRVAKDRPWIRTVCEIGFNAGHSAMAYLTACPTLRYIAFDLGDKDWTRPMFDYLSASFPNRMTYVHGSSIDTVPVWEEDNFTGCDIVSVDGWHEDGVPERDIENMMRLAKTGAVLLADDWSYRFPDVGQAWDKFVNLKQIKSVGCYDPGVVIEDYPKNWCFGFYQKGGYPVDPANVDDWILGS